MFPNLSINSDTGNLNVNPVYNCILKNKPIFKRGVKILQNHQRTRLPTRPKRVASIIANKRIISQHNN